MIASVLRRRQPTPDESQSAQSSQPLTSEAAAPSLPRVLVGRRLRGFAGLVANGLGQAASAVATALLVEYAFDTLLTGPGAPPTDAILRAAGGLALATAVAGWLRGHERVAAERVGQHYTHELRIRMFDHLSSTAPRAVQQRSLGATNLRFIGDLNALRKWISLGLARLVVGITMIVGTLTALAFFNLLLAGLLGAVLLVGAVVTLTQGPALRRTSRAARSRRSTLAANVNERIATVAVMQVFGQARRERSRVKKAPSACARR